MQQSTRATRLFSAAACILGLALLAGCASKPERNLDLRVPFTVAPDPMAALPPEGYEAPPERSAAEVLPAHLLDGEHYAVDPVVVSDGRFYHYLVRSDYGDFPAMGYERLLVRINEINGIATLKAMQDTEAFGRGVAEEVGNVVTGPFRQAGRILRNPLYAVAVVPSEVFRVIGIAGTAARIVTQGIDEEYLKDIVGYYDARKALANELDVDPETANPVLDEQLNEVAWAFFAGIAPVSVAADFLPGIPMSVAIGDGGASAGSAVNWIDDQLRPSSPGGRMRLMEVDEELRDQVLQQPQYSSRMVRGVVDPLYELDHLENREAWLRRMLDAPSVDAAHYVRRTAGLMEHFHLRAAPVRRLDVANNRAFLHTDGGDVAWLLYADRLYWTPELTDTLAALEAAGPGATGAALAREVWLTGEASERARTELARRGWYIREDALAYLEPYGPDAEPDRDRAAESHLDEDRPRPASKGRPDVSNRR